MFYNSILNLPLLPFCLNLHPFSADFMFTDHVTSPSPSTRRFLEMETTDIQPCVTLEAINSGEFGGEGALDLNNITALDVPEPEFLVEFRAKLKRRRCVTPETVNPFFITYRPSYYIIVTGN